MTIPTVEFVTREVFGLHNRAVLLAWDYDGPIMGVVVTPRDPVAWSQAKPTPSDKRRMERAVEKEFRQ